MCVQNAELFMVRQVVHALTAETASFELSTMFMKINEMVSGDVITAHVVSSQAKITKLFRPFK
jgi:hypothetical protein